MSTQMASWPAPSEMVSYTTEAYFSRVASSDVSRPEPESELLGTIRRALQHHEPPSTILDNISQTSSDGVTVEELAWGRTNVVSILGGRVQRQWTFPREHEEIRSVCWAYFEEKSSRRKPPQLASSTPSTAATGLFQDDITSVFGPYAQKMRQKASRPSTADIQDLEGGPYGPGTGAMVRAVCIIFRSFAQIQLEDGTEHCIHVPFLTRRAWPLFPVGLALEQEPLPEVPPWASSLDLDPTLYSLSSPLRAIAPIGVAHQIQNTTSGTSLIYQEDVTHPNQDNNTFLSLKNGERVIFVSPYSPSSPQIIFTVDTRLMSINCYSYAYAPIENSPRISQSLNLSSGIPSPRGPLLDNNQGLGSARPFPSTDDVDPSNPQASTHTKSPAQWLMGTTPPPASWRDSRRHEEDEFELNAQLSVINSVLMDIRDDDDEEVVGPDHWLQKIASILVDPERSV